MSFEVQMIGKSSLEQFAHLFLMFLRIEIHPSNMLLIIP